MTIYVQSIIAGKSTTSLCSFRDKKDLDSYATEKGVYVKARMSIQDILSELYDTHICTSSGSVTHRRISLKDAKLVIRSGAYSYI
jgi:hypothetical protein